LCVGGGVCVCVCVCVCGGVRRVGGWVVCACVYVYVWVVYMCNVKSFFRLFARLKSNAKCE